MITLLLVIRQPRINMNMLHTRRRVLRNRLAHEYMVELLAVAVVEVRVSLRGRQLDYLVEIL